MPDCIHYWLINDKQLGTCKKCGAVKQFPTLADIEDTDFYHLHKINRKGDHPMEVGAVTPGAEVVQDSDKEVAAVIESEKGDSVVTIKRAGRLTPELRKELLELGWRAFAKKYNYAPGTEGGLSRAYKLAQGKQAQHKVASVSPKREPPQKVKCDTCGYECDPRAMHLHKTRSCKGRPAQTGVKVDQKVAKVLTTVPKELDILLEALRSNLYSWGADKKLAWCRVFAWTFANLGVES